MSKIKNIIIYNPNTNEKSRIHINKLSDDISNEIDNIYCKHIFSEDNIDYLSQTIDINKDEINTKRKLKQKLRGQYGMNAIRDIFMDMPAMNNIISELLSRGIIKNQYKLISFDNYKERGINKDSFDSRLYGSDKIEPYNAKVIQSKAYCQRKFKSDFHFFNKQLIKHHEYYAECYNEKIFLLDGISFPEIVNDDNNKNYRYVKRCINKLVARGKEIKISDTDEYDYLINVDEDSIKLSVSSDLAYFYYYKETSWNAKNCYLEMNNSYNDKKEIWSRTLEHLFLASQIINKDGEEFTSELSEYFGSYFKNEAYEVHDNLILDCLMDLSYDGFKKHFLISNIEDINKAINKIKEYKDNELQTIKKNYEDNLLEQSAPDVVINNLLEIVDNIVNVEEQYNDALINSLYQLQNKFDYVENLLNK